ncbi:MAG: acyl-CoA thioesterase [Spirochaetales bacterium]|nr:acyl-CoA thioesterase [Spirochaetales bacterium]
MKNNYLFTLDFDVRDYELDLQGIVNNSVYQNYLEHARHRFLKASGADFAKLHDQGIDAVVTRVELDFKRSLVANDSFWVGLNWERKGRTQIAFLQDIYRGDELILRGKVFTACIQNGGIIIPDQLVKLFEDYQK